MWRGRGRGGGTRGAEVGEGRRGGGAESDIRACAEPGLKVWVNEKSSRAMWSASKLPSSLRAQVTLQLVLKRVYTTLRLELFSMQSYCCHDHNHVYHCASNTLHHCCLVASLPTTLTWTSSSSGATTMLEKKTSFLSSLAASSRSL